MDIKYKKLIFLVLGLFEIIAGLALFSQSTLGAAVFIALGIFFIAIMFIVDRQSHYDGRKHFL